MHKAAFQTYSTYAQINPQTAIYKVPNVSWIKELVRQNKGISLMVKDAVKDEPGIVALDIKDPIPEKFFISLATREDYILSDDEQQLITKLKEITPVA